MKKEFYNFKTLTLITDDIERLRVIQNNYCCDITKDYYNPKYSGYRDYIVLKTFDNLYFIIDDSRPTISSDLYYDDETEAPGTNKEAFICYNKFYNFRKIIDNESFYRICIAQPSYFKDSDFVSIEQIRNTNIANSSRAVYIRDLTEEEENDLKNIDEVRYNKYLKRLETYYKKYNNKIYNIGYWANR